jgi:hypothetical protein
MGAVLTVGGFAAADVARLRAASFDSLHYSTGLAYPCTAASSHLLTCSKLEGLSAEATRFTIMGITGVAIAASGVGFVLAELLTSSPEGGKANARVAVVGAPGGGALTIMGSF